MVRKKLTPEEQLIVAIEQLALGREYITNPKKSKDSLKVSEFVNFLNEMRNFDSGKDSITGVERKYSNYRNRFKDFGIPVRIDFQGKYIENYTDNTNVIKKLVEIYLKSLHPYYNQHAVDSYIANINNINDALYYLTVIKYCIQHKIKLEFTYNKFLYNIRKPVRILPLAIICGKDYLNVAGYDVTTKNTIKQYMISRILEIKTNLYREWSNGNTGYMADKLPHFHYEDFIRSEDGHFQYGAVRYRIQFFGNSYDYFMHTYYSDVMDFKIIKKISEKNIIAEFFSFDERQVFNILFSIGEWCRLLEPEEVVERFLEKIDQIRLNYKDTSTD